MTDWNFSSRDIVDTEPSNGNVWKMLLGAINPTFDNDSNIQSVPSTSSLNDTIGTKNFETSAG